MLVAEVKVEFTSLGLSALIAGIPDEMTMCKDLLEKEEAGVAFDSLGVELPAASFTNPDDVITEM